MSDPAGRPRRSREASRQLWVERLARFPASGLSITAFCATECISVNAFFYGIRQLAATTVPSDAEPHFPGKACQATIIITAAWSVTTPRKF